MTLRSTVLLRATILTLALGAIFSASNTFAQTSCGKIIAAGYFFSFSGGSDFISETITDCANPFNIDENGVNHQLKINGVVIDEAGTAFLEPDEDVNIEVRRDSGRTAFGFYLFKHSSPGYLHVNPYREADSEDVSEFAEDYFSSSEEADLYTSIYLENLETGETDSYFYDEDFEEIIDVNTGESIANIFYNFTNAFDNYFYNQDFTLEEGTYTIVVAADPIQVVMENESFIKEIFNFLLPTAHAQFDFPRFIDTITFNVSEPVVEPTGASSILFLPGIMGSRLYEEGSECAEENGQQERWFSVDVCDHLRLQMDFTGSSVNSLYTLPGEEGIVDETFTLNLYKSFLSELREWKSDDVIDDYKAIPYDWRLGLDDILKTRSVDGKVAYDGSSSYQDSYLYKSLEELADTSKSGKVTLVTHSNGGMVAKILLKTMKINDDPLLDKVDNLILIAVPQSGTPEAIVGMLHGSGLGPMGLVLSQSTSRKLMETMPFAHHLLPNQDYFDLVETPVITFADGEATAAWLSTFGNQITSQNTLQDFLRKDSGRVVPDTNDLTTPAVVEGYLFGYVNIIDTLLQDWEPETDTSVYQIAGTGIETPASIEYFTDQKCAERNPFLLFLCTRYEPKLGYRVEEVIDGDATVVVPSALALEESDNVENWWLDLLKYESVFRVDRIHRDIVEVPEISEFIFDLISDNALESYTYLDTTAPDFSNKNRILLRLHSPLDLYVVLSDGEIVSSSTLSVRGVEYRHYGEIQQLSIPEDEEDYEIRLIGLAYGSFTLDIEKYENEELEERITYSALPSDISTKVLISFEDEDLLSGVDLLIDYNGDGVFDAYALPGLGQSVAIESENTSTTTPMVSRGSSSTGTKVRDLSFSTAPSGLLTQSTIESTKTEYELMLELIQLLTQYRDLLIKFRVK